MRTPHAYRTEQNTVYMLLTGMNTAEDSCHGFNKRSLQESLTDELIAQMQQSQIYLRSDPTLTVVEVCVVSDTLLMKLFLSVIGLTFLKCVKINLQGHFQLVATENQLTRKYFLGSSYIFLPLIQRPALFLLFPDVDTF